MWILSVGRLDTTKQLQEENGEVMRIEERFVLTDGANRFHLLVAVSFQYVDGLILQLFEDQEVGDGPEPDACIDHGIIGIQLLDVDG